MNARIPPAALLLAIAGLTPFLIGALVSLGVLGAAMGDPNAGGYALIAATDGRLIMARFGVIILCFMAGVLWGFSTKATGTQATACYALSTLPAVWVFLNPGARSDEVLINLMIGFVGVLILDYAFFRWQLAPGWWMSLRIPITAVVLICLAIGVWA